MREVGVISPGKAVSEEPHLRVLTLYHMRTFRHHLAITGRPRKSRVVTDPARVDADRPKRVVRRTLNEYHSHLMAGPRLHSQLTHRALFKLLLATPMTGSCRPPAVHRLKP